MRYVFLSGREDGTAAGAAAAAELTTHFEYGTVHVNNQHRRVSVTVSHCGIYKL